MAAMTELPMPFATNLQVRRSAVSRVSGGACYITGRGLLLVAVDARLFIGVLRTQKGNEMSYRAIYVAAVTGLGIACVSVDALTARVAADGVPNGTTARPYGTGLWALSGTIRTTPPAPTAQATLPAGTTIRASPSNITIQSTPPAPVCLLAPAELPSQAGAAAIGTVQASGAIRLLFQRA